VPEVAMRDLAGMIRRVGRTSKTQARWLVEQFARKDVFGLFGEELTRAGWELAVFLAADTDDDKLLMKRLAGLRRVARRSNVINIVCDECWRPVTNGLKNMVGKRGWRVWIPESAFIGRWSDTSRTFSWRAEEEGPWDFSGGFDRGQFVDMFHRRIYETLGKEASRLRICLECRRPFIANGRQQYCRRACSQTRRTRDWRRRHPAKVRTARRAAYERQMQKQHGAKVKVQRRSGESVVQ